MKLVRDRIPELYPQGLYVRCDDETRKIMLKLKLAEEIGEVLSAVGAHKLAEELADVLEVVDALTRAYGIPLSMVATIRDDKLRSRGGFSEGWVLR